MDDLISRQAAIDKVTKHYRIDNDLLELIAYEIELLPSTQPEITRCKDCRHFQNGHLCRYFSRYGTIEMKSEDFCSRAERREDGKVN